MEADRRTTRGVDVTLTAEQRTELQRLHWLSKETDTKNMLPDQRSQLVQETLIVCRTPGCWRPVCYVFVGRGAEDGICLTCWEVKHA